MDLKATYNRIAEDWHRDHQNDDWWIRGTDTFISLLPKGGLILDVGCGGGTKSRYFIERGLRVVGIDFSEKMIEIAKREVPTGTFLALDMSDVDRLENVFDAIYASAVFVHIPRSEASTKVKKLAEKLKTGGYLYSAVKGPKIQGIQEEVKIENDYGYPYERFFSYFTAGEVESFLREANCEVVYSEGKPSGNARWIEVIGKKRRS
ncbi:MAG: class I SAM-dependent methyltransferase [Candidatus Colwellbacteria bacterium]|nr:class I SAM-dependent methyltransferase [Candidatus Colwellbacteria bacterium]